MRILRHLQALPLALLLLLPLLAGCELVDQRTVARWTGGHPPGMTSADLAAANLPALPLVTIRYDDPSADPAPALAAAAEDALARKPDATFEVITAIPTALPPTDQDAFVRQGTADARQVADDLATAGVDPSRIHLGLRGDPGRPVREVRVYVH